MNPSRTPYPTDVSDDEWAFVAPYLTLLPEDITVTEQLVAAGIHLDIELVDHLVIGNHRFVSLKERLRW